MKRQRLSAGRIEWAIGLAKAAREGRIRGQQGSIVLEAAIVVPLILIALIAFSLFISLCGAQMALHSAASQAARGIAAHIYPVELARAQAASSQTAAAAEEASAALPGWTETAADIAEWLPEPAGELVSSALRGDWSPLENMAATELGRHVVEPYVRQYVNESLLKPERVKLAKLVLPDLQHKEEPYIVIALEYEYPVKLPFVRKAIVLREQAFERVWVSDKAAAAYGSGRGENDAIPIQIVSIEPVPLRPGHKATAVVKTDPGAAVSLDVVYKSGSSKAKHLGQTTADAEGYARWTWHVSGNTTPGLWHLTASSVDGRGSASKYFAVEKKPADG